MSSNSQYGQFIRLSETERPEIIIHVDGRRVTALAGDTVLTALMLAGTKLRDFEFGAGQRGGFCLMGACQDCWVSQEKGGAIRACTSYVADGMRFLTDGETE